MRKISNDELKTRSDGMLNVTLDKTCVDELDAFGEVLSAKLGFKVKRSDVVRHLIKTAKERD